MFEMLAATLRLLTLITNSITAFTATQKLIGKLNIVEVSLFSSGLT